MSDNTLKAELLEHPRLVGVLFTLMLLATQASNAAAGAGHTFGGPVID